VKYSWAGCKTVNNQSVNHISSQDILKIAETVKFALKDEIDKLVQENVQKAVKPLQKKIVKLEAENKNLFMKLDDLEQYGRRPLIRVSGIQETNLEDTTQLSKTQVSLLNNRRLWTRTE
jgi:hypothetical protein